MERSEINRNKKGNLNLKVFCVIPRPKTQEDNKTSIYEINIESDVEVHLNRGTPRVTAVKESKNQVQQSTAGERKTPEEDSKNPFIESYYPVLQDINSRTVEPWLVANDIIAKESVEDEEKKIMVEKADKENQSPSSHFINEFQENIKNYIIRTFTSNKSMDTKAVPENGDKGSDNSNGFHFHHHEHHHHHYYFNENGKRFFSKSTEEPFERPHDRKEEEKDQIYETEDPKGELSFQTLQMSNQTFTKSVRGSDELLKDSKQSSKVFLFPKCSPSAELISQKKSDFLRSHTYSDPEVARCDEVSVFCEAFEMCTKSSEFITTVKSKKSLNDFKSSVVIKSQESVPQISYIASKCTSPGASENSESESKNIEDLDVEKEIFLMNLAEKEESQKDVCLRKKNISPSTDVKGSSETTVTFAQKDASSMRIETSPSLVQFEILYPAMMAELQEIKSKLKRIERKRRKEENALVPIGQNSKSTCQITVYSSRTFIVTPTKMSLRSWWERNSCERERRTEYLQ